MIVGQVIARAESVHAAWRVRNHCPVGASLRPCRKLGLHFSPPKPRFVEAGRSHLCAICNSAVSLAYSKWLLRD
jgi:hypothetical protein